jgi:putative methionine-R-sulfoxide reductase with GAF domain
MRVHYFRLMSAILSAPRPVSSNRRTRVRHKAHVPAYATLGPASTSGMLDLYEVLDISEAGVAIQCSLPIVVNQILDLCLDLAEAPDPIWTTGRVVWNAAGRVGLSLPQLPASARKHLKQWLFLNALSAADYAEADLAEVGSMLSEGFTMSLPPQNHTDILDAASAIHREVESLGPDLQAALSLIASRCRSLLRASGVAIALEGKSSGSMICRASAGPTAPPTGLALEIGSGFSGECVHTGKLLRCADTETDPRVDIQTCRALGIRSMLAAPLRAGNRVVGLLEVFSQRPNAFSDNDTAVLQRFTETIVGAFNRAVREYSPLDVDFEKPDAAVDAAVDCNAAVDKDKVDKEKKNTPPAPPANFAPAPGSVLFASAPGEKSGKHASSGRNTFGGVHLPRAHLLLLLAAAATIALALGFMLAPWIQEQLQSRHSLESTVLASSNAPADAPGLASQADSANLAQLQQLASQGDASAENTLGLLYIAGDDKQQIKPDETVAAQWFTKAAEHASVPAQSKLGSLYWGGRGVPKDDTRAYFWTVLARANGDDASRVLAPFIATRLTSSQRKEIEQQAEQWLQSHESAKNTD